MEFNPIAFSLGTIEIRWYGILIALAILIGTSLATKEAERQEINTDHLLNVIIFALPAAFICGRLYYVIFNWDYYKQYPLEIPATWHGGLAIHGALIGAFVVSYFVLRRYKINFWQAADVAAPSIILGQAIGRWGNFFNQEAYGYEVSPDRIPWAMFIDGAYRHPTFLYESLWNLGVFIFLLWLRRRKGLQWGDVFLSYVMAYSLGRLIIEGFRTDSLMLLSYLRVAQVVSIVAILLAGGLLVVRHYKQNNLKEKP